MKTILYEAELVNDPSIAYGSLLRELAWIHADAKTPRKEYYVHNSGFDYTYGAAPFARTYKSQVTHPVIEEIRYSLLAWLGVEFDVVFLNLYENERHHLGWHADDSPEMSHDHPIVSVSLGAEREIWFREKGSKEVEKLMLKHGSACAMLPGMQRTHEHRIPKCDRVCGPRISLTFRKYNDDIEKYIINPKNALDRKPNPEYMERLIRNCTTKGDAMLHIMRDYRGTINPAIANKIVDAKFK